MSDTGSNEPIVNNYIGNYLFYAFYLNDTCYLFHFF